MTPLRSIRSRLAARLAPDARGAAMLELALLAPVLLVMLVGMIDGSLWVLARMTVERSARAGAEYAVENGYNSSAITTAITGSAASHSKMMSAVSATPAPNQWCGCATGTNITAATCGSTCASGLDAGTYVTSSARSTYTFIMHWPGSSGSQTVSAQTSVRID